MHTILGLLGLVGYVAGMLVLSAGITAAVVRIAPTRSGRASKSD